MTFTALTIKQPWATLMVTSKQSGYAHKSLEGRTWETSYRGLVLIHTGQQKETAALQAVEDQGQVFPQHFPKGAILGMAELVACRRPNTQVNAALQSDCTALFGGVYQFGLAGEPLPAWLYNNQIWLWEFRNPMKFKEPILCKGKLRLWTPEICFHAEIERQIALAKGSVQ